MQVQRLLWATWAVFTLLLTLCAETTQARRVIFYNPQPKVLVSQLLISRRLSRPCPQGKMRDHRDRCRRAVIFGRN